jgi:putative DNA methylase
VGKSKKGLTLVYDVARRFAQPLGIHLDRWENRIIVIEKGIVRLLPVIERAEQLLGEDGAIGAADLIERTKGRNINYEFAFAGEVDERPSKPKAKTRKGGPGAARDEAPAPKQGTTTLDRVHIAMLLQKSGKSNALRTMLKSEIERGPDFLRLANALSALYPKESEEKRLLDAMLLAAPR